MEDNVKDIKQEFDLNGDGKITPEEINAVMKMRDYVNKDEKIDAQKQMAWRALYAMIFYPVLILIAEFLGLHDSAKILGDMSGVYFGSVAVIVSVFMGAEAYKNKPQ